MSKALFLSGLAKFEEDVAIEITYSDYTKYLQDAGRTDNVDPVCFPQNIEFEFSTNTIISNHHITSSEPIKFRYIYDGTFKYSEKGFMTYASIDSVTIVYHDLYPGDEWEYGYFYKTDAPIIVSDINSFAKWEDAMNAATDDSALIHEYEEDDGIVQNLEGSGKLGIFRSDNSHLLPSTWHEDIFESDLLQGANSTVHYGTSGNDNFSLNSGDDFKHDIISLGDGNDYVHAFRGADKIFGGSGNDELRAGNGRDIITGGAGGDTMYGGFGLNTFEDSADGEIDQLFFKSDQWAWNWLDGKAGNSPNGEKADKIVELDEFDEIYVQGVSTSQLSYGFVDHDSRLGETLSGIGIYASGALEAVYVGDDLSMGQISAMTQGVLL